MEALTLTLTYALMLMKGLSSNNLISCIVGAGLATGIRVCEKMSHSLWMKPLSFTSNHSRHSVLWNSTECSSSAPDIILMFYSSWATLSSPKLCSMIMLTIKAQKWTFFCAFVHLPFSCFSGVHLWHTSGFITIIHCYSYYFETLFLFVYFSVQRFPLLVPYDLCSLVMRPSFINCICLIALIQNSRSKLCVCVCVIFTSMPKYVFALTFRKLCTTSSIIWVFLSLEQAERD